MTLHPFPAGFLHKFWTFGMSFAWQAQYLVTLEAIASPNVNAVSYLRRINHESRFWWQTEYSVTLESHFS